MFETAVLSYGRPTKRVWATFAGFGGQVVVIGCALLAPLLWPQVIPRATWAVQVVGLPLPRAPKPPVDRVATRNTASTSQIRNGRVFVPVFTPPTAVQIVDVGSRVVSDEDAPEGVVGGERDGVRDGIHDGILISIINSGRPVVQPPKPVVTERPKPTTPTTTVTKAPPRISDIELAKPIRKVEPVYPILAKQARISGTVRLEGVLGTDGRIHELRAVSGHPLLIPAAMEAVRQWVFAPTILNGQPVEVQAPIEVNFILNR